MIGGNYSLVLYCDKEDSSLVHMTAGRREFHSETYQESKRIALEAGWRLNEGNGECICPLCLNKGLTL